MAEFSPKQKSLAIVPKPFAALSLIGSSYIVYHILHNSKRRKAVQYQILLGLSLSDILFSIAVFLGTWPIPAYVNDDKPTVYLASGTDQTCDAHGFFIQWTIMTPIYNASLSLYYVLVCVRGWNERKLHKFRYWFHILPVGISLGTAIAGSILGIYGNATLWCWIIPGSLYRWAFYYGILWFCALIIIIPSMTVVYLHVRKQEAKAASWAKRSGQHESYEHSKKVMQQGLFFSLSFIITWIFPTLTRLMQAIIGSSPFWLIQLMTIFLPMQGLINAMVFLRPKYVKYRKDNPGRSLCSIMMSTVFGVNKNSSFVGGKNSVVVTMFKSSNKSGVEKSIIDDELVIVEESNNNKDNTNDGVVVEDEPEVERRTSIQWKDEENGFEEEKVEEVAEDMEEGVESNNQISSSPSKSLMKGSFTETSTKLG